MKFSRGERILVDLHELPEKPGPYTMSFGFNLDGLRDSITRVGLIALPLVARNQEGSFEIVSGYRRILAMKEMGEHRCICEDVTSVWPSPLERLLAGFYENLATRKFNDMEKALILDKLQNHAKREEILNSFMPLLSLPSHEGTLQFYLKLVGLEEDVQLAIAREEVSTKAAKVLVEIGEKSRRALFQWISKIKLNLNQQLKLIEYVQDISVRENLTVCEVLLDPIFTGLAEEQRLNNPQKAKALLEMLRIRRYPRLTDAQYEMERMISAIPLPPGASIQYDQNLEDPLYRLEIKFASGKDLKAVMDKLHAVHELEAIPELWRGQ
jgi:ParB-like chromosome segregation protein Spo0J